jgi:cobalt/nickel transport system permease protein
MKGLTSTFDEIEEVALRRTWMRARSPLAKIMSAAVFLVVLVSYDRRSVGAIFSMFAFPVVWASLGGVSIRWVVRKISLPLFMLAIFAVTNVYFDREICDYIFGMPVSGGVLSWFSIVLRAALSLSVALLLISTTGMVNLAEGLIALGIPRVIVVNLLIVYRYIFVLADEASSMNRARVSRSCGKKGMELSIAATLIGQLLVRSLARAERIHAAMASRGLSERSFEGLKVEWRIADTLWVVFSLVFLLAARFFDVADFFGILVYRVLL